MERLPETQCRDFSACRTLGGLAHVCLWMAVSGSIAVVSGYAFGEDYRPGSSISSANPVSSYEGVLLGPFIFSPSAKVGATYDDNVFNVEEGFPLVVESDANGDGTTKTQTTILHTKGGTIATGEARLAFKLPFSHSYAQLIYVPQYRDYLNLTTTKKTYQTALFEMKLNFSGGSSLTVKNDFVDGFFDARTFSGTTYELSSTPYRRNDSRLDYDWSLAGFWGIAGKVQRTSFVGDKTTSIGFADTTNGRTADQQFELFDYDTNAFELRGYYNFARFQVFATGTYGRTVQDRTKYNESVLEANGCTGPDPASDCGPFLAAIDEETINQWDLSIGAKGRFSPRTRGEVKVGYSSWDFRSGETEPYGGVSLAANIEHQFSQRTFGYVKLDRSATQATGQYSGYYVLEGVFVRMSHQLTPRLAVGASLTYRTSDYPEAVFVDTTCTSAVTGCTSQKVLSPAFRFKEYSGSLEASYRPGQASRPGPLLLMLQLTPRKSTSDLEGSGLDADGRRATLTLQYGWF